MTAMSIEALEAHLGEITTWLHANRDKMGTPKHRQKLLAHAALNTFIEAAAATPEQKIKFVQEMTKIADGTHPRLNL